MKLTKKYLSAFKKYAKQNKPINICHVYNSRYKEINRLMKNTTKMKINAHIEKKNIFKKVLI